MKNKERNSNGSGGGWFKSLNRLTKRGKNKAKVSILVPVSEHGYFVAS
jgi:hypothetical protein